MKTYEDVNRDNYKDIIEEIRTELNEVLVGQKVSSTKYGNGTIKEIEKITFFNKRNLTPVSMMAIIEFGSELKSFDLETAIRTNFIVLYNNDLNEIINQSIKELEKTYEVLYQVNLEESKRLSEIQKLEKEQEELKKQEKELKEKLQKKQEKTINELNKIKKKSISSEDSFYNDLGWIINHVGTISAQIPDYLESWFDTRFGSTSSKTVIDSLKKTSGGYSMKWNPSFTISFKNLKNEVIPSSLQSLIKKNKINNVGFVFDLVENYGFVFGQKQNIDEIKKHIPTSQVENFELGLMT